MEQFMENLSKAMKAVGELFEKIAEAIKKVWSALRPFVVRAVMAREGLVIVNRRGRNKLVYAGVQRC